MKKKNKGDAVQTTTAKGSKLPIIIAIIAGAVLIAVIAVLLTLYFTGPKRVVKQYAKASFSKKGGKTYLSLILTENIESQLKEDDKWEDMIDKYGDFVSDNTEGIKYKVKKVIKRDKLSSSALKGAEIYFRELSKANHAEYDYPDIKKGFEFKIKIIRNDKKEKAKEEQELIVCAVKVKKQGWRIIERSEDDLEKLNGGAEIEGAPDPFKYFSF